MLSPSTCLSQAPFYANVDEQTLMNDCARSAIANVTSYAQVRDSPE
jgi:hypothetical protein